MKGLCMASVINVAFASIAALVINYVTYSIVVLAASNGYVNGDVLVAMTLEFMILFAAVFLYSWRHFSFAFKEKRLQARPSSKAWKVLRLGFSGASSVLLVVFVVVTLVGLRNLFVLFSLIVAAVFVEGVWFVVNFTMRIVETRESQQ